MAWLLDDGFTENPDVAALSLPARWHYLAVLDQCALKARDWLLVSEATLCSDVDNPLAALAEMAAAGLVRYIRDEVHVRFVKVSISSRSPLGMADYVKWALAAELPHNRQLGVHLAGRVLVALAAHANAAGECWPSQHTLAADISHCDRRDVRNALDALASVGLIQRVGRQGRSDRWQLVIPSAELAGP